MAQLPQDGHITLWDTKEGKELRVKPATFTEIIRHPKNNGRYVTMDEKAAHDEKAKIDAAVAAQASAKPAAKSTSTAKSEN